MEDHIPIGVFDGSDLIHLGLFKFDKWNQVTCSRWLCSSEKINIDMLAPSLDEDWNTWLRLKEINSKKFKFVILFKFELIGMSYY